MGAHKILSLMLLFLSKFMGVLFFSQTGSKHERRQKILQTRALMQENGKGNEYSG